MTISYAHIDNLGFIAFPQSIVQLENIAQCEREYIAKPRM